MLCQSSHSLILYFQNDQSGQPVLTFGKRSPLKSDQDHFLSWNYFLSFPIMFLTSCKPPLSWLIVWGDSLKTTHLHILVGYSLEVHLHFPFLVGLKYYLIITCFTFGHDESERKGVISNEKKEECRNLVFRQNSKKIHLSLKKLTVPKIK